MEMERIERAYELLSVTEKNHTQTIRNAYRKVIKINKKNETLTPELSSEAKAAMYLLIERRKRMKSEVVIQRDAQLHDEIRVRMNAKKFFAPRLWFKIALPIIIWAILQEIIMASTDIVDNIFVNWMKDDQIQGLAQLQDDIKTFWGNVTIADLDAAGLSHEYLNLTYHAGQIAVNGVTASNQLYTIMYCVVSGACYGIGVYSAQFYGAGNKERLRNVTALKFYFTLSVAGLFAMIAIPGITEPLIKFTTNPGAAIARPGVNADVLTRFHYIQHEAAVLATNEGIKYFRTIFWSYLLLAVNESIITSLRETRRPIYSFIMSIVSLLTNCVLNLFLTAPNFLGSFHGLGVQGTAIATALSRVIQLLVISLVIAIKRFEFFPVFRSFAIPFTLARQVLLKAAPIIFNELLYAFGQVLIVKLKGMYSVEVLTANAMYATVIAALLSPLYHGLNAGISVFVGNELGANRFDIAQYNAHHLIFTSIIIGLMFGLIMMGVSFVVPDILFSAANAEAKRNATWMMFSFGIVYPIYVICNSCYSIMRTGGSMWGAFLMDSGMVWTIQIPLLAACILLYKNNVWHVDYIWIHIITLTFYVVQTTLAVVIYTRKTWVRNVIDGSKSEQNEMRDQKKLAKKASDKLKKDAKAHQENQQG